MKKTLSLMLSLIMVMTTLFALPFTARAALPEGQNQIYVRDEFRAWGLNDGLDYFALYDNTGSQEVLASYKGMSYDEKTNTLNFNNVPYTENAFWVDIHNMGDLTINVTGNSGIANLGIVDTNVTITGSGTLTLNPAYNYVIWEEEHINEHIFDCPVHADNSTLHIDSTVNVKIENGYEESASMEFYFKKQHTELELLNDVLTYDNKISERPVWTEEVYGGPVEAQEYYGTPVYKKGPYTRHKFPATNILYKVGSGEEGNYYIKSIYDYYDSMDYIVKLVEKDGIWFESDDNNDRYHFRYGESESGETFANYTDISSLPSTLVDSEGYATANLDFHWDSNDPVFIKNNQKYVLVYGGYYYNWRVNPVEPAETKVNTEYPAVMLKLCQNGNDYWLEYEEEIPVEYDSSNYYQWQQDVVTYAASLGYAKSMYTIDNEYEYCYRVTNNQLSFTATQTKPAAPVKTDVSKLTISGIVNKTYTGSAITQSITVKDGNTVLKIDTDYTVAYKNNTNAGAATVTISGKGNYTGTISKTFTISAKKVTPTVTLSATSYTYDGKAKKPTVTIKDGSTKLSSSNYTVSYASGRKNVGTYKVTVTLKGNYSGSKSETFKINPKNTTLSSVKATSKGFTAKWKKYTTQTTGYQIQYSTDKNFKKSSKTVTVSKNSTTSKKVTKLTGKKKYYVRIRTYETVSGTKYYSSWSKAMTVTTKK